MVDFWSHQKCSRLVSTLANCDAPQGVSRQRGGSYSKMLEQQETKNPPQTFSQSLQNPTKLRPSRHSSNKRFRNQPHRREVLKSYPRAWPNLPQICISKIDPRGLLETSLDHCFKKTWFLTPPKRSRGARDSGQERPRDTPDRPKPLPNAAEDPLKSSLSAFF